MFLNPQITKQLADEHRRDLIADAQQQTLARQIRAGSGTTGSARHSATVSGAACARSPSPRLEPQA